MEKKNGVLVAAFFESSLRVVHQQSMAVVYWVT